MRIAVAGGTGIVGSPLVETLGRRGHDVVVLSRGAGVDVLTGTGLDTALAGCEVVVDVLSTPATGVRPATAFFTTTTRNLLVAGRRAGVGHHLTLSIVGIDTVRTGYYRGKLAQEAVVGGGATPWTLLRATQFHEFAGQLLGRASFAGVAVVPAMRVRPVAATTVADRLAALATAVPQGRVDDLGGPAEEDLVTMARAVARRHGVRRVLGLRVPGAVGRAVRAGGLLPGPEAMSRGPGFTDWLDATGRGGAGSGRPAG